MQGQKFLGRKIVFIELPRRENVIEHDDMQQFILRGSFISLHLWSFLELKTRKGRYAFQHNANPTPKLNSTSFFKTYFKSPS